MNDLIIFAICCGAILTFFRVSCEIVIRKWFEWEYERDYQKYLERISVKKCKDTQ